MRNLMRRKHQRCAKDTAISYTYLNKTKQYGAIARNYSRFGMYFETYKSLVPGTMIVIRYHRPDSENSQIVTTVLNTTGSEPTPACQELKTQIVGEVKRCEKMVEAGNPRFGIAVHYISPAA